MSDDTYRGDSLAKKIARFWYWIEAGQHVHPVRLGVNVVLASRDFGDAHAFEEIIGYRDARLIGVDRDLAAAQCAREKAPWATVLHGDVDAQIRSIGNVTHAFLDFCSYICLETVQTTARAVQGLDVRNGPAILGVGLMRGREREQKGQMIPLSRHHRRALKRSPIMANAVRGDCIDIRTVIADTERLITAKTTVTLPKRDESLISGSMARLIAFGSLVSSQCVGVNGVESRRVMPLGMVVYHSRDRDQGGVPMLLGLFAVGKDSVEHITPKALASRCHFVPRTTLEQIQEMENIQELFPEVTFGMSKQQFAALKAHATRGTYGGVPEDLFEPPTDLFDPVNPG